MRTFLGMAKTGVFSCKRCLIVDQPNTPSSLKPRDYPAQSRQPSPILDSLWYPTASRLDPASYICFVASVRECPVKLFEASTGRLRASYWIIDHANDRHVTPHSMAFNLTATRPYCGFESAIEVFDVENAGEGTRLHTTPSKKSNDGLQGIISALAFSSDGSYSDTYFAAGSFILSPYNIGLYNETQGETPVMFLGSSDRYGRVTQKMLWAYICNDGTCERWIGPYQVFQVYCDMDELETKANELNFNQKMKFDIDAMGSWLSHDDEPGRISTVDLMLKRSDTDGISLPTFQFEAHSDAVGSVSFNSYFPFLFFTSESRHFNVDQSVESDESSGEEDAEGMLKLIPSQRDMLGPFGPFTSDRSVKIWDMI